MAGASEDVRRFQVEDVEPTHGPALSAGADEILFRVRFILSQTTESGTSTWFEGVLLLAVYAICAAAVYCVP